MNIQAFIAQPTIEGLANPIVHGLSKAREVKLHFILPSPEIQCSGSKFGALVHCNARGQANRQA